MTRRTAIAISGLMTASLMAGMVGAQLASSRFAASTTPAKVTRLVQQAPAPAPPPATVAPDQERE
jgi:hypothetical protein